MRQKRNLTNAEQFSQLSTFQFRRYGMTPLWDQLKT